MNCIGQEKDEKTEDRIIKDIRKRSRLKKDLKGIDDTAVKDTRNLFRLRIH